MSVKKAIIILIIISIIGIGSIYFVAAKKPTVTYSTTSVIRGKIIQTVNETGTVKAANELDLSFLNTGKISKIYSKVGQFVQRGASLTELDYSSLTTKAQESQAGLDVAQENLNKLLAGATNEEIAVSRAAEKQANTAYEAAKKELIRVKNIASENEIQAQRTLNDLLNKTSGDITTYEQAISSAETSLNNTKATYQRSIDNYVDSAIITIDDKLSMANNALDVIDRTINDEDGKDLISIKNISYLTSAKNDYANAQTLLTEANADLLASKINSGNYIVVDMVSKTIESLNKVFSSLGYCYNALENSIISSDFTQAKLDVLKTNIAAEQTVIAAAIALTQTAKQNLEGAILDHDTNVSTAEDSLRTAQTAYDNAVINAKNSLSSTKYLGEQQITLAESKINTALEAWQVARAELNKLLAPTNKYDNALLRAKIRQAQAALNATNRQIEDSKIVSPIDGVVTKIEYEVGERVLSGAPVISVLGKDEFDIEVLISEADIAKININNNTKITLDAYGDDIVLTGRVKFIEPAETVIQDVIYYKVIISFNPAGQIIKSGMTANTIITTAEKDNVLIIPSRAVINKNGMGKFTRILAGETLFEKKIMTGLRGDDGLIEVISGVNENEKVVTYIKEK